jgi:hypothetical protein
MIAPQDIPLKSLTTVTWYVNKCIFFLKNTIIINILFDQIMLY